MSFLAAPSVETHLLLWLLAMIRPSATFLVAPIFGASSVPVQLRLVLALALAVPLVGQGLVTLPPPGTPMLIVGVVIAGEVMIGIAMGLVVQTAFASATMAGEVIGNSMGLGFASMIDPSSNQHNPALGQLLMVLATFLFFAMDGHLLLIRAIIDSFVRMPVGHVGDGGSMAASVIGFGGAMFAAGLAIALPVGFATVLVQLVMAMLARSAPQLNLFAIGLPATLIAGIAMLAIGLPEIGASIGNSLTLAIDAATAMSAPAGATADMAAR